MKEIKVNVGSKGMMAFLREYKQTKLTIVEISTSHASDKKQRLAAIEEKQNQLLELTEKAETTEEKEDITNLTAEIKALEKELTTVIENYNAVVKPLRQRNNRTLHIVNSDLYKGYIKKLEDGKRGQFLEGITQFAQKLGVKDVKQAEISGTAERISDMLGKKLNGNKAIMESGKFTSTLSEKQFKNMFLSVFCDLYIKSADGSYTDTVIKAVEKAKAEAKAKAKAEKLAQAQTEPVTVAKVEKQPLEKIAKNKKSKK